MRYEKGNFITVPNKSALKQLDALSQALFLWLCSFADEKGQCYPSVNRLCECTGLSRKTVIERVKVLIEKGFITKTERYSDNSQQSNLYQIHLLPSATNTPPGVIQEKRGVYDVHAPSPPATHEDKSNQLKSLEQKEEIFRNLRNALRK